MGSGINTRILTDLPAFLSKEQCQNLCGNSFDEGLFVSMAIDNKVSKDEFLKAVSCRTDCFLTHDWGRELEQDNHERVGMINHKLKEMGLKTWFDQEQVRM